MELFDFPAENQIAPLWRHTMPIKLHILLYVELYRNKWKKDQLNLQLFAVSPFFKVIHLIPFIPLIREGKVSTYTFIYDLFIFYYLKLPN